MKNLNGKDLMRGDDVIALHNGAILSGRVFEFYDRSEEVRISGFALPIKAHDTLLAADAWEAFATPLLKAREEAAKPVLELSEAQKQEIAAQAKVDAKK